MEPTSLAPVGFKYMTPFNNQIRQIVLLIIIAFLGFLIFKELFLFLPGLLGALTTYILTRDLFFTLIEKKKWKTGPTAALFIFCFSGIDSRSDLLCICAHLSKGCNIVCTYRRIVDWRTGHV